MCKQGHDLALKPAESMLLEELRLITKDSQFVIKPRLDDEFLLKFLRVRNYNVENAYDSIQKYCKNVKSYRHYFQDQEPMKLKAAFKSGTAMYLNGRSAGHRVATLRVRNWDTTKVPLLDIQRSVFYQAEYVSMEPETQDTGIVFLFDISGLTFTQVWLFTLKDIKWLATMLQGAAPFRTCEIHLINVPSIAWPVIRLLFKLLPKKLRERVFLHETFEELHNVVDLEILPKSLGGNLEDSEAYDTKFVEHILAENVSFEGFWNPSHTQKPTVPKKSLVNSFIVSATFKRINYITGIS